MKTRTLTAVLCAALCLTGCTAASSGSSQEGTAQSSEAASETAAEQSAEATDPAPETSAPETEPQQVESIEVVTGAQATNKTDNDTKILFSERGLDAVPVNDPTGYGEELKVGAAFLDWTLESFNGDLTDDALSVTRMDADFSRAETRAVNGILTVLSKDDPNHPNAMLLRVDNQGDFPSFIRDYRERGKYIIENSRDVFAMLELKDPPVDEQYELAVSVSVSALHIHMSSDEYDTIRVTAASKR